MVERAPLVGVFDGDLPDAVGLADLDRAGAGADFGAAIGGVARGEHHQARVVDEAVGIFKSLGVAVRHQRLADLVAGQIDRAGRRQQMPAADMVVEKQPEPQQPGRAQAGMMRQHESQRADDVGRDLPEDFALDQRLADQAELVIFEIAQAAMHQLGRPGRRPARQVVHFAQENRIAAAHRIARDAAAVDAATDDSEVENPIQRRPPGVRQFTLAISLSFWIKSQPNPKANRKWEELHNVHRVPDTAQRVAVRRRAGTQRYKGSACGRGSRFCGAAIHAAPRPGYEIVSGSVTAPCPLRRYRPRPARHRLDHLDAAALADVLQASPATPRRSRKSGSG